MQEEQKADLKYLSKYLQSLHDNWAEGCGGKRNILRGYGHYFLQWIVDLLEWGSTINHAVQDATQAPYI